MRIWVDADACPQVIKEILFRAAERTRVLTTLVANTRLSTPSSTFVRSVLVGRGFDVADHWIAQQAQPGDLVITADIPLAAQVIAWPGYRNMNGFDRAVFAMAWLVPAFVMEAGIARLPIAPLILLSQFLVLLRWVKSEAPGPQKTAMAAPGSVQGETA